MAGTIALLKSAHTQSHWAPNQTKMLSLPFYCVINTKQLFTSLQNEQTQISPHKYRNTTTSTHLHTHPKPLKVKLLRVCVRFNDTANTESALHWTINQQTSLTQHQQPHRPVDTYIHTDKRILFPCLLKPCVILACSTAICQ